MNLFGFLAKISLLNRLSLRTKLVSSFLFIVIAGGVLSSLIGTKLVADTIILQARNKVKYDLSTAWLVYNQSLNRIRDVVQLTASGRTIPDYLESGRIKKLEEFLCNRRKEFGLDILTLTDAKGKVILRTHHPFQKGDDQSSDPIIQKALKGEPAAFTAIVSQEELQQEGSDLAERALIITLPTPKAKEPAAGQEASGMMLKAAAPVLNDSGRLLGVLYGGTLLNRNYQIVDQIRSLLYGEGHYKDKEMGTATIFQGGVRISTNVLNEKGDRAIGTRISEEVFEAVVQQGQSWLDRAFVVKDWYITGYEPIRDITGRIVGILYVGMLEAPYIDLRNKVVYSFFGIGVLGVLLVLLLSFFITTGIIRPLQEMVFATRKIAEGGDLSLDLSISSQDEIGRLAESFNHMLIRLKQARQELEDYGRTLEEKVEHRSQQLKRMQSQLMQSEKLASLGRLASGVAHEINSPLTGILTFSHLLMRKLKDNPELQKELELIVRETTRVSIIVRGLLDFARESKPQKRPCNINELILHTLTLIERQSVFQNIRIMKNLDPQIPMILLDTNQIQQVFMNILLNAADAMPAGGALNITTFLVPEDSFMQIKFTDTGCGIPEKNLNKIFDPFFTTKADKKGTGLGLAVSYGIIDRHCGQIEVQSAEGKGTTFIIKLPLKATEDVSSL
ncbi:MAG: cache domain-containing protein [Thermodesulfobacteriota bacterium]|nr:cache domain-containing protein [Thermodesulfobacteriota bacterium]